MSDAKIAVVGAKDVALALGALGIQARPVSGKEETARAVFELAQAGCAVIFITEDEAALIPEMLSRYRKQRLPAIIPIPGAAGSNGLGMEGVRQNAEKAAGGQLLI